MADTVIQPNNKAVVFGGGKRGGKTMPPVSEKQRGAMAAASEGKSKIGISKEVGEEFMDADEGGKLPEKAPKPKKKAPPKDRAGTLAKQGLISDKALKAARAKMGSDEDGPEPIVQDEENDEPTKG